MFPMREATPRAPRGIRPLWFGLVTFDRTWLWTPTVVGGAFDDPGVFTLEPGLSGGLQLDIEPRRALVYVDGWYVGLVDQFSGYYSHIDIGAGSHTIEILATGYEPLIFEIAISPGRTTTYRGSLQRAERND
jgi:PEGA domain